MRDITLEELLSAGCHFGHQVNRRNPKANDFIFEARQNVHIIDLGKTREGLLAAAEYVKILSAKGGYLVIVGTKRQAKQIVKDHIERAQKEGATGLFYTITRWVGGTFTNFPAVSQNFKRLDTLTNILNNRDGAAHGYTKRELLLFERERQKLISLYGGIAKLDRIPDAVFIIDTHQEATAVREAKSVGVTTIGIVDTNADPYDMTYPIPANDDAVGSIELITSYLVDAWVEGQKKGEEERVKGEEKQTAKSEPRNPK